MQRISTLLTIAGVLLFSYASAQAQTATVNGTVDWTALAHFTAQSAAIVFVDVTDFENPQSTVVPLTGLADKRASYAVTLKTDTPYFVTAIVADCASNPQSCGTAAAAGTHVRFHPEEAVVVIFAGSPPPPIDVTADSSGDPVAICGNVSVQSGTFVKLFASAGPGGQEQFYLAGVYSTALVNAPATSYCVQGARFSFTELDSTVTIQQNRVPTCAAQVDVLRSDFLSLANDPVTNNIAIVVPAPAGRMSGTFSVTGFAHDFTQLIASNAGPTIGDCAGTNFFFSSGPAGSPLSFDVSPVLSGTWRVNASVSRRLNTPDGMFQVTRTATAVRGSDYVMVVVPAGGSAVAPLTFKPGVVAGNFPQDVRRWGGPTDRFNTLPTYEGTTKVNEVVGAGFTPALIVQPPMRFTERYELNLDPRGTDWVLRIASGISYGYTFPSANGSSTSGFGDLSTLPTRNSGAPFVQSSSGNFAVLVGNVTAGATLSVDLPAADFRIATVTMNPPTGGSSISWSADRGQYALTNGVLDVRSPSLGSFSFDSSAVVGHAKLPPGLYNGTTSSVDSNFNSFVETRRLDLQPDDDLTADFGAPMLLGVRPIPGAAGGSVTVTGTVVATTPTPTSNSIQVLVNGASATVGPGGSFSRTATIGTGPLTVVARDNRGRTTTLKRYFTTMTGLLAPAAGADLVSAGQDVVSIQKSFFVVPTASGSFHAGATIPLKLTGALGSAAVTSANAAAAPRIVAVLKVVPIDPPTTVHPTGGETVFRFASSQWVCNLSTTGLSAGTYVVQIQFWDGRILETALVLV
jgi:hypothetical protein